MVDKIKKPVNSSDIRAGLLKRYQAPEWCIMHEVANGTGAHGRRYADCLAMNLFPSRGLSIHGIEIKISRSDLMNELKKPDKADEIAQYCDFWFVATPKGLCDPEELPMAWGLLELQDNGIMREGKKAIKLDAKPIGRPFVAAMARRIHQIDEATINRIADDRIAPERERMEKEAREFREERDKYPHGLLDKYQQLLADIDAFEKAFGFKLRDGWRGMDELCKAAEMVRRAGLAETYSGIIGLRNTAKHHLDGIEKAMKQFGIEEKAD